jgi:hypothetical protein
MGFAYASIVFFFKRTLSGAFITGFMLFPHVVSLELLTGASPHWAFSTFGIYSLHGYAGRAGNNQAT